MAKLSKAQTQLLTHATYSEHGIYTSRYQKTIQPLITKGYLTEISHYRYVATPAGLAYLYQDAPMVDQPQHPADVQTIDGEVSFMAPDGKIYDGTIKAGADRYGYTIRAVDGTVYDEIKRSDIEPRLVDEIDDLPFTDIGKEATQELPVIKIERTPCNPNRPTLGDALRLPLADLVDAALDPDNQEAFESLKAYDLTNVPLWILEIERNDLADLKWALWSECRKINAGTLMSNPDYVAKQIEVNRAFQVCDILHKEVVNRKAVGFNVEN